MKWNPKDKLYVNPYGWNSEPSRKDEVEYIRKDKIREIVMYARNMSQTPDAAIRNWDSLIQEIDEL